MGRQSRIMANMVQTYMRVPPYQSGVDIKFDSFRHTDIAIQLKYAIGQWAVKVELWLTWSKRI